MRFGWVGNAPGGRPIVTMVASLAQNSLRSFFPLGPMTSR